MKRHARFRKPDTKDYLVYDSISMKYTKEQMKRNRCRLVGAGTEGTESDCLLGAGFPFWDEDNVLGQGDGSCTTF